jgi:hypothetical protein
MNLEFYLQRQLLSSSTYFIYVDPDSKKKPFICLYAPTF